MANHERRLRALEQRTAVATSAGPVPILSLPVLPEEDRAAFRLAEQTGDEATVDELVLKHTGVRPRPGPGIRLVVADVVERPSA